MSVADLAIVAALVFVWGTLSARLERFDVTAPILFVLAGLLLTHGPLAVLAFTPSNELIKELAEFTLALVLFSDASRVSLHELREDAGVYVRLLGIALPVTIGLAFLTAILQTVWHRNRDASYLRLTKFFGVLLVINVAVGVVTGLVQEFQFGMDWSVYSRTVGDVFGAPLAMEGLAAFFLESTFLGLWIFGWDKLPKAGVGRAGRFWPEPGYPWWLSSPSLSAGSSCPTWSWVRPGLTRWVRRSGSGSDCWCSRP